MFSSFQFFITILLLNSIVEALMKKPTKSPFILAQKPFDQIVCSKSNELSEITDYPVNDLKKSIYSSLLVMSSFAVFSLPSKVFAASGILVENGDD